MAEVRTRLVDQPLDSYSKLAKIPQLHHNFLITIISEDRREKKKRS